VRVHLQIKNILGLVCLLSLPLCGHAIPDRGFLIMKEIQLTKGYVAQVDDLDYELVMKYSWRVWMRGHNIYAIANQSRKDGKRSSIKMHRLILAPKDNKLLIDHIDGDSLNNQRSNLRLCTNSQNQGNQRKRNAGTSVYKGVHNSKGKWIAQIGFSGNRIYIGRFTTEQEAALAYNNAAKTYYGEFSKLNVIK